MKDNYDIDYSDYASSPKKRLLTPIGNILESVSYGWILVIIIVIIVSGAWYYWKLSPEHGVHVHQLSFSEALYLSFATFTSYTDINPVGFGKLIAALQVTSGIVLIALFIGKVASERQGAWLLLIYTSEQQKRLIDFAKGIMELKLKIELSVENIGSENLKKYSLNAFHYLASIKNYLNFQANQGRLASFGNDSALKNLYEAIQEIQLVSINACRYRDIAGGTRSSLIGIIDRAESIGGIMTPFHKHSLALKLLTEKIVLDGRRFKDVEAERNKGNWEGTRYRSKITTELLEKVFVSMPELPWEKNIHKKIALQLGITNSLSHRCISELVEMGRWPSLQKSQEKE